MKGGGFGLPFIKHNNNEILRTDNRNSIRAYSNLSVDTSNR